MKKSALYPGSFDPFTRGHEDIVERSRQEYDLRVLVGHNPDKKGLFAPQERVRLAQTILRDRLDPLSVVRVAGSVPRYAQRVGVSTIIRGKRNAIDEIAETQYAALSRLENPDLQFQVLESDPELEYASSSAAKELIKVGHDPSSLIRLSVQEAITSRLLSQYLIYITGGMGVGKSTIAKGLQEEAKKAGFPVKYVDLDGIGHDIYEKLDAPIYVRVRHQIAQAFGGGIQDENGWIDRKKLAKKISVPDSTILDPEKLKILNSIMGPAIKFRYQDIAEGFQGIILIDGAIWEGGDTVLKRFSHNHALLVGADKEKRIDRVERRYADRGAPKERGYIESMMDFQGSPESMRNIIESSRVEEEHGGYIEVDNSNEDPKSLDRRKNFFRVLNEIDTFGELRAEWILRKLGVEGKDIRDSILTLQNTYNAPHRYYHTWEHIVECLDLLFEFAYELDLSDEDMRVIGGAILWHDYFYDTYDQSAYKTNEERSAIQAAQDLLKYGVKIDDTVTISRLIRETMHGRTIVPDELPSKVLHDIDMAILGAPRARYRQYALGDIPDEFAPMAPNRSALHQARIDRFIKPTLERIETLFLTKYGQNLFTESARSNLAAEMQGTLLGDPEKST